MALSKTQNDAIRQYVMDRIVEICPSRETLAHMLGVEGFADDAEYYAALSPLMYLTGRARGEVRRSRMKSK